MLSLIYTISRFMSYLNHALRLKNTHHIYVTCICVDEYGLDRHNLLGSTCKRYNDTLWATCCLFC